MAAVKVSAGAVVSSEGCTGEGPTSKLMELLTALFLTGCWTEGLRSSGLLAELPSILCHLDLSSIVACYISPARGQSVSTKVSLRQPNNGNDILPPLYVLLVRRKSSHTQGEWLHNGPKDSKAGVSGGHLGVCLPQTHISKHFFCILESLGIKGSIGRV